MATTLERDQFEAPMFNLGEWLVERRSAINGAEAAWLDALAEFDTHGDWAADGTVNCAAWLMHHCGLARSTAFEKLAVAHQLRRRPPVAAAFASGRISYCAVRVICRADDASEEVEESLINLAQEGPLWALQRAVNYYLALRNQDRPPAGERPGLRCRRGYDGEGGRAVLGLSAADFDEFVAAVDAFIDPVEESARADTATTRAEALMAMVRCAMAHRGEPALGQGHTVHVVTDLARRHELLDGTPLRPETLERLACDGSVIEHLVRGSEPLALGRKTRVWNTAQRRAIALRDQQRCRFPGCERRFTQVHHVQHWIRGGPTDVANGALFCTGGHHTALHEGGFECRGDANGVLTFYRPDGSVIGASRPPSPVCELGIRP